MAQDFIKKYGAGKTLFFEPFVNPLYRALQEAKPTADNSGYQLSFSNISLMLDPTVYNAYLTEFKKWDKRDGKDDNQIDKRYLNKEFNRDNYFNQRKLQLPYMSAEVRGPASDLANYVGHLLENGKIYNNQLMKKVVAQTDENEFNITLFSSLSLLDAQILDDLVSAPRWPQESLIIYSDCGDTAGMRSQTDRNTGEQTIKFNTCHIPGPYSPETSAVYKKSMVWHERAHRILKIYVRDSEHNSLYEVVRSMAQKHNTTLSVPQIITDNREFGQLLEETVDLGLTPFYSPVRLEVKIAQLKYRVSQVYFDNEGEINADPRFYTDYFLLLAASDSALAHMWDLVECEESVDQIAGEILDLKQQEYKELKNLFIWAYRFGQSTELRDYIQNHELFSNILREEQPADRSYL